MRHAKKQFERFHLNSKRNQSENPFPHWITDIDDDEQTRKGFRVKKQRRDRSAKRPPPMGNGS